MEKITSFQNPLIKKTQSLREASHRREQGMTLLDGAREIQRAHQAGIDFERLFYVKGQQEALVKELQAHEIDSYEVSPQIMEKLAYGERHDGLVAVIKTPDRALKNLKLSKEPLVVVLEALEKPGNLGAVLRTCDAVGVEAVLVCDPKTDVYNPNVIRSSTGVVFSLPVVCATASEILAYLKARKIKMCAASPAAKKIYTQIDFRGAWAIVLGSEDQGLSDVWLEQADTTIKIPMNGVADSLNVSISAAIILYEAIRQRKWVQ